MVKNQSSTGINNNLLILHFTVFIWGFTGILGALITLPATQLVWYRLVIAVASLFLYFKFSKTAFKVNRQSLFTLALAGALVGAHWILFFGSIKFSTVSVGLVCLSSLTLFTAILEPLINKTKISRLEIVAGICIIIGILTIFKFETQYTKGIVMGLLSALCASLFSIINSKQVKKHEAPVIAFYELTGAFVWLSAYMFLAGEFASNMQLDSRNAVYLLILGTVCTSVAYVAGVSVMRELSAFKVALITNLEPVYGILMAFVIFGDMNKMTPGFWVGASIILSTIFMFPFVKKQLGKRRKKS